MIWPFKKDKRGTNPNSLATLAQINAEKRAAIRARQAAEQAAMDPGSTLAMTRQAMQSAAPPLPRAPPTPPPQAGSAEEFFNNMMRYETWRQQVYETEQRKREGIAATVEASLREKIKAEVEGEATDPVTQKAMEFILDAAKGAVQAKMAAGANRSPPAQDPAQAPATQAPQAIAQPSPGSLSQEQADAIADAIEDKLPDLCKKARSGEISRDAALAMLRENGVKDGDAEQIYQSVMDVDDEPEGAA